jgi:hypothetical protein
MSPKDVGANLRMIIERVLLERMSPHRHVLVYEDEFPNRISILNALSGSFMRQPARSRIEYVPVSESKVSSF